jgi:hypothetical protein
VFARALDVHRRIGLASDATRGHWQPAVGLLGAATGSRLSAYRAAFA